MRTKILLVWFILFPVVKCYMWYVLFNVIDFETSYYSKQYKNYVSSSKIENVYLNWRDILIWVSDL